MRKLADTIEKARSRYLQAWLDPSLQMSTGNLSLSFSQICFPTCGFLPRQVLRQVMAEIVASSSELISCQLNLAWAKECTHLWTICSSQNDILVSLARPEHGCPLMPGYWEDRDWGLEKSESSRGSRGAGPRSRDSQCWAEVDNRWPLQGQMPEGLHGMWRTHRLVF